MTENAWPFLIGRARNAGYRVVVVPDFMADAASVDALSGAARDVRLPADAACAREVHGLPGGTVLVVYRSFTPRGDDYGLGADELTDGFGRPIRVTEGFVLRRAATAGLPRITVADLEQARAAAAGPYRDFWRQERDYSRRVSTGFPLGAADDSRPRPVRLEAAEPWGPVQSVHARVDATPRKPTRRTLAASAVTAAVLIATLVVGRGLITGTPRSSPPAASVLGDFCDALKAGLSEAAYGFTAPQLRRAVSPAAFARELLSTAPRATTCTYAVDVASASAARGTVTVGTGSTPPTAWSVSLAPGPGASWLINSLTRVF